MVDKIVRDLEKFHPHLNFAKNSGTQLEPLVFEPGRQSVAEFAALMDEYNRKLEPETVYHLQKRYGARWQRVADLAMQDASLRERVIPSEPDILAEAKYSLESEMAVSFEDFLRRRTLLAVKAPLQKNIDRLGKAAALFGESQVTEQQIRHEIGRAHV